MNHFQQSNKKIEKLRGAFFQLGIITACGLTFLAFEWKTVYTIPDIVCGGPTTDNPFVFDELPPVTTQEKITRPKVKIVQLIPNMDEIEIVSDDDFIEEMEEQVNEAINDYNPDDWDTVEELDEKLPEPPTIAADVMPEFIGGEAALFDYLKINTKYDSRAIESAIEGTVHVQFVVGKSGKIRDIKIQKGVNKLLDREAMRVVQNMPNWIPGVTNGEKVAVYFNLPIHFKLRK